MGRKERNRRISPVVDPSERRILDVELEHRQQLDGSDAELLEIWNLLDQTGIGAACFFRNPGTGMARETSHVHLVNDGPGGGAVQRRVAFPIVSVGIHHHALHRRGGVVAFEASSIAAVIPGNNYAAPVRVEENLGGIKPHPARGIEWPLRPDIRKAAPVRHPARIRANNGRCG